MAAILDFFRQDVILVKGLIAVAILLVTFLLSRLLPKIEQMIARHITGRTKTELDDLIANSLGRATRRLVWLVGFYFIFEIFRSVLPVRVFSYRDGVLYVLLVLVVANFISRILKDFLEWYAGRLGDRIKSRVHDEFGPLFKRLIVIIVYSIAIIHILHYFKQNVSSLIVSLGVGSLAVALAAKDTLANMISGFMIMTDRPFRIGDRILLESGEKGDVYDIGLRSTKILTFDNTLIVVPNQQIINEKVTNLSYPDPQIRIVVEVGVAYGTDLDKAKMILVDICRNHPDVLQDPPPKAYFVNFGDSSLDLRVVCRVGQWGDQWRVGEELRMSVKKKFEEEGIEIPFPQRVVYVKKGEGSSE